MPKPGSTEPTFGPTWPNTALSEAMVSRRASPARCRRRWHSPGRGRSPVSARRGSAACNSSTGRPIMPRPSYWPSCADWSPPVQNARSPAPAKTMTPTDLSQPARLKASISSSQVLPRNAFITAGRLMVIRATPSVEIEQNVFVGHRSRLRLIRPFESSGHGEAARHAHHLAGDERGVVAGEEADGAVQVVRLAEAAERDGAAERLVELVRVARRPSCSRRKAWC